MIRYYGIHQLFLTKSYLALYLPRKYCYLVSVSPSEYVHLYYPTPAFTLHELACSTHCSIGMAIRVASVIGFSVCLFSVLCLFSVTFFLILYVIFFLILLQYDIRPPDPNCDVCAPEFAARVNLRRHDTLTRTAMNVMMIFYCELS